MSDFDWNSFMFGKLSPLISDNWVFVDVGANKGEFIDFFKTFKFKKIYAFELSPDNSAFLKSKYHGNTNIIIENYAVCDIDSNIPFYNGGNKLDPDKKCLNILGYNMDFEIATKIGEIRSTRLDTYFKDTKVDLMKIDVEGSETQVLRGLKNMPNIDNILLECHLDRDWHEIKILLQDYNFQCINFHDDSPIIENSPRPYQCLCSKKRS